MTQRRFIVATPNGLMALDNYEDGPPAGLLLCARAYGVRHGNPVAVFDSITDAKGAIRRSVEYAERFGYEWGPHSIYELPR